MISTRAKNLYLYAVISNAALLMHNGAFAQPAQQPLPDKYNITLTPQELDLIGNGLGSMPFKDAAPLINKLREQVMAQQPKPVEKPPVEPTK
jgi:hypothetical protein